MTTDRLHSVPGIQLLRLPQVCRVTGLCRSMIYRLEACESFPRRIKIGSRAVGWVEGEVQEWLANRIAGNRCSSARPRRSV
ncbi:MAG: AlpA family transcriptional regulator [Steroidobacteraceae bacterium]